MPTEILASPNASPSVAPDQEKIALRKVSAGTWVMLAALVACVLKLAIAYNTFGTNDVVTFYSFARSLSDHGLEWTYKRGILWLPVAPLFNHPPMTAYFLRFIDHVARQDFCSALEITFPFLLRLPGILADLVVVWVLCRISNSAPRFRLPTWALILFALSPVSLMVSGFHGNTDPVMVMFLVLAAYMCLRGQPWLCGLFLALSCQVKIIPILFFPIFFLFWWHRRAIMSFLFPLLVASVALWWEPLTKFPLLFAKNVLSYGSYWGIWGITYWLRLTGYSGFNWVSFMDFPWPQTVIVTVLKVLIIASILLIAWRRRALDGRGPINSIAYSWVIFFVFAPGVCAQYMVWLAPFILVLSPSFYAWLTVTSSLFLFFFYNTIGHGLPWYIAISTSKLNIVWTPWTVWPWSALIIGGIFLWRKAIIADPALRLFSLETLPARPRD